MGQGKHAIVLVESTSHAIRAEKVLGKAGLTYRLIPIPQHLNAESDCSVCVRVRQADAESVLELLTTAGVEIKGFYRV